MKKNSLFFLITMSLMAGTEIIAQKASLPFLRDVLVKCSTQVDPRRGIYSYIYTIRNGATSVGKVISIEIDISRDSAGALLAGFGLYFKNARLEDTYRRIAAKLGHQIIPVSFPDLPTYCDAGVTFRRTVDFFGPLIQQGQEVAGFTLSSRGMPGIRLVVVSPQFEINDYYPSVDEVSNPDSLTERIDADREAVKFRGVSIGPTAPPADFAAMAFVDTLLSYTRQSADLGWLGKQQDNDCDEDERPDDGIVKNIELRLQKAKRELTRGDSVQARKELENLVQKVERIWKRAQKEEERGRGERWEERGSVIMSSEAYALLKYNTEYLIDRLPEKSKHGREDDKDKKPKE